MKRKLLNCILLSILHLLVCILSGAAGWHIQTVVVPAAGILAIVFAGLRIGAGHWYGSLTVVPFYTLYIGTSIALHAEQGSYPIWFFGLVACILTVLLLHYRVRPFWSISALFILVATGGLFGWPNYFSYISTEKDPSRRDLSHVQLTDSSGRSVAWESFKGKVVLFDLWSTSCYRCIKKFPELNELYNRYKEDTLVRIIALNLPERRDKEVNKSRFIQPYAFEKMFITDTTAANQFSDNGLPLVLITDKNGKCRFAGELNTGWNIFSGNAWRIINKLKNE